MYWKCSHVCNCNKLKRFMNPQKFRLHFRMKLNPIQFQRKQLPRHQSVIFWITFMFSVQTDGWRMLWQSCSNCGVLCSNHWPLAFPVPVLVRPKDGRIARHGFEQVYHMTPGQEALWILVFPTLTEVRWDIGVATGYTGVRLRSRVWEGEAITFYVCINLWVSTWCAE